MDYTKSIVVLAALSLALIAISGCAQPQSDVGTGYVAAVDQGDDTQDVPDVTLDEPEPIVIVPNTQEPAEEPEVKDGDLSQEKRNFFYYNIYSE